MGQFARLALTVGLLFISGKTVNFCSIVVIYTKGLCVNKLTVFFISNFLCANGITTQKQLILLECVGLFIWKGCKLIGMQRV